MKAVVIYPAGSLRSGADPSPSHHRDAARRMEIQIPECGGDEIAQLETIFRMMNCVDGSACEHYLREFKERSMCVGDMVEMNNTTYICDSIGWKKFASGFGFMDMKG